MQPPYAPSGSADGMDDGDKEYSLFSLTISIEMLCNGCSVAEESRTYDILNIKMKLT